MTRVDKYDGGDEDYEDDDNDGNENYENDDYICYDDDSENNGWYNLSDNQQLSISPQSDVKQ